MPNRILGLNISFAYVDDYESLVQFVNELRPAYCVMIVDGKTPAQINDQIAKAKALTARMPYTIWIYRVHNDDDGRWWFPASDGRPQIATAQDYINEYGHLGQNGGILSVLNEPSGFLTEPGQLEGLVQWTLGAMRAAIAKGVRCCILNWADRNPRMADGRWEDRYRPIAELAAEHPELFTIGIHAYGPDGIADHIDGYALACDEWEIDRPAPLIITEMGLDSTGTKAQGYRQHGWNGVQFCQWKVDMFAGPLQRHVASGLIIGAAVFCWNWTWDNRGFDVQRDGEWKKEVLKAAGEGKFDIVVNQSPVAPKPSSGVIPSNVAGANKWRVNADQKVHNIRTGPGVEYADIGDIQPGETLTIYKQPVRQEVRRSDGFIYNWQWAKPENAPDGWVCMTGWGLTRVDPTVEVPIVKDDETPVGETPIPSPANTETPAVEIPTPNNGNTPPSGEAPNTGVLLTVVSPDEIQRMVDERADAKLKDYFASIAFKELVHELVRRAAIDVVQGVALTLEKRVESMVQ